MWDTNLVGSGDGLAMNWRRDDISWLVEGADERRQDVVLGRRSFIQSLLNCSSNVIFA